jgi:signal transduction histidine kinase
MQNQINLTPISQFAQILRSAELSQQKEVKMSISQARLLNLALTEIQDKLLQDYQILFNALKNSTDTEVVTVAMDGGSFETRK